MMRRLGIEYIDLVYFHQPVGDYVGGWKEMEQALALGKVRAIGISNFDARDDIFDSLLNAKMLMPKCRFGSVRFESPLSDGGLFIVCLRCSNPQPIA